MGVSSLAAVTRVPNVLAPGSCSHLSPQLHRLPVLGVSAARRSCALLQPPPQDPGAKRHLFFFQTSGKSLFIVGWGHPSRSSCSWDHPLGQSVSPSPREGKEHPSPLLPSLKQRARTILQGRALQTYQPPKRPNTLLEDVLSNRHG